MYVVVVVVRFLCSSSILRTEERDSVTHAVCGTGGIDLAVHTRVLEN